MNILVTRHNETIKLFWDLKIIDENTEILDHIDDKNIHKINGKNVIGIHNFYNKIRYLLEKVLA